MNLDTDKGTVRLTWVGFEFSPCVLHAVSASVVLALFIFDTAFHFVHLVRRTHGFPELGQFSGGKNIRYSIYERDGEKTRQ